jgi:hypothetical protein
MLGVTGAPRLVPVAIAMAGVRVGLGVSTAATTIVA